MSLIEQYILPGLTLLPQKMDTSNARAMLAAIGLQESGFNYRKQVEGPARGYWQFEKAGISGVLSHYATKDIIEGVCKRLLVPPYTDICYGLIAYHDALACCFARLLLWTHPDQLPNEESSEKGWHQYIDLWRPGKPREKDWPGNFKRAWEEVKK